MSALKDMSEVGFLGRRDCQNNHLPSYPSFDRTGYAQKEWTLLNVLSTATLLGKACEGTLRLAGLDAEILNKGNEFGINLALAWQVIGYV